MTIRVLGGLLSAHHLSGGDPLYLCKVVRKRYELYAKM
jgi:hypothetical protein